MNKYIIIISIILFFAIIYLFSKKKREHFTENPVIPLNIFQTWKTKDLPPKMQECVDNLKAQNPEFNHYVYDNYDCYEFIRKNFDKDILDAYDNLIPGAFKADLWRYCVLYKYGGVYLDIKYQPANNFKLIDLTDKEYFVRDITTSGHGIYNAFMICKPGNKFLLKAINKIAENVKNKYYGSSIFSVTGPILLREQFTEQELDEYVNNSGLGICDKSDDKNCPTQTCIAYKNISILAIYNEYRDEQKNVTNIPYYRMWDNKEIYKKDKVIPLHIYQTWKTKDLPPKMQECINDLKDKNPEFTHHLYDNNDCYEYIKDNFDKDVLDAYDALKPGAFKADLWRYCILYKNGGVYLDIKFQPVNNFKLLDFTDKEYFVRDIKNSGSGLYNAFMICKPQNPNLLKAINNIVENTKNNFYGNNVFTVTGPLLLNNQFSDEELKEIDNTNLKLCIDKKCNNCPTEVCITHNNNSILAMYKEYREEQVASGDKYYYNMWVDRDIYN